MTSNTYGIRLSPTFLQLVDQYCAAASSSAELGARLQERAQKEGIDNETLRSLIEEAFKKRGLSERQIFRLLPDFLKDPERVACGSIRKQVPDMDVRSDNGNGTMLMSRGESNDDNEDNAVAQWKRQALESRVTELDGENSTALNPEYALGMGLQPGDWVSVKVACNYIVVAKAGAGEKDVVQVRQGRRSPFTISLPKSVCDVFGIQPGYWSFAQTVERIILSPRKDAPLVGTDAK